MQVGGRGGGGGGQAGDGGSGHGDLARILHGHGLSEAAVQALETLGSQLRARTLRRGVELAAMVDADTGTRLGSLFQGTADSVNIGSLLRAMQPGRAYASLHTHPTSSSFSDSDAVILVRHSSVRTSLVTGADGTWYVLSKIPGTTPAGAPTIVMRFWAERASLNAHYLPLVRSGAMSGQQAWREHSHQIWRNIAGRLGLRYDRVQPV